MVKKIVMFHPYVTKAMRKEVQKTLCSRFIGQGPRVDKFEEQIKKVFKVKYPVTVNSGTAALTLAYYLAGVKKGDEVITPALTCNATNLPLLHAGAKIIFADVRKDTLNIDPEDIKRKITPKTKLIVNAHLNGNPSDIGSFIRADFHISDYLKVGVRSHIPVVGDMCQLHTTPLGCDDYICYSFQAIKHITTGDGGLLVVRNKEDYKRAKKLRWFGIDREKKKAANWQPYLNREITMDIEEPGWKLQMSDIMAAMGIGALKSYYDIMAYHYKLQALYTKLLKGIDGLTVIGGCWAFPVLVERRDDFGKMLMDKGIETNLVQLRNDIFTCFGGKRQDLPNMNEVEDKYTYLPLHMLVTEEDVYKICSLIRKGW